MWDWTSISKRQTSCTHLIETAIPPIKVWRKYPVFSRSFRLFPFLYRRILASEPRPGPPVPIRSGHPLPRLGNPVPIRLGIPFPHNPGDSTCVVLCSGSYSLMFLADYFSILHLNLVDGFKNLFLILGVDRIWFQSCLKFPLLQFFDQPPLQDKDKVACRRMGKHLIWHDYNGSTS